MEKYDDIINLPHHVSKKHPQMSLHDRAAQFAPFAALTGYDEEVKEVSRITDQFHPLESKKKEEINQKLCILQEIQYEHPLISICYFVPDKRKAGGSYTRSTTTNDTITLIPFFHIILFPRFFFQVEFQDAPFFSIRYFNQIRCFQADIQSLHKTVDFC